MADAKPLAVTETKIPGLLKIDLPVHGDNRGWFKENWQKEKMVSLGMPADFQPVQNNISFNQETGVTRGIHAEPWNKYISIGFGKVFAAIVDFRPGETFGVMETFELTPEVGIFVPKGCGNSFQTLEPNTVYTYLVDAHWSPEAEYSFVNLADEELNIPWPIPLDQVELSEKDKNHPPLKQLREDLGL
jgi:dTDP-4-dehydrorhamnose 3,5-epimerase